jgi:cellobiose-specific phosphotransferase system component IIC
MAERRTVAAMVAGSSPVVRPSFNQRKGIMVANLQQYNAFGGIVARKNKVTINITAIHGATSIHRTIARETNFSDIQEGEVGVAEFGILITDDPKGSRIYVYELIKLKSGRKILALPKVRKTIEEVINIVRKAIP